MILLLLLTRTSYADWQSLTGAETAANIAEFHIDDDLLRLELEVSARNASAFWPGADSSQGLEPLFRSLADSATEISLAVEANGKPLTPSQVIFDIRERKPRRSPFAGQLDPRTGQRLPDFPEDKEILFLALEYQLSPGSEPIELTLVPPASGANLGFITFHQGIPVNNFAYLSAAERLRLNRQDPWLSQFDNQNIRRQHVFPLDSYLYLEPLQARHQTLIRLSDLWQWLEQGALPDALTKAELAELRREGTHYLMSKNPVQLDGLPVEPDKIGWHYLGLTETGLQVLTEAQQIPSTAILVGFTREYWYQQVPQTAEIDWQLFHPDLGQIPSLVQDAAGPFPTFISEESPQIQWQNLLKNQVSPQVMPVTDLSRSAWKLPLLSMIAGLLCLASLALVIRKRGWLRYLVGLPATGLTLLIAVFGTQVTASVPRPEGRALPASTAAELLGELLLGSARLFLEPDPAQQQEKLKVLAYPADSDVLSTLSPAFEFALRGGGIGRVQSIADIQVEQIQVGQSNELATQQILARWQVLATGLHWGHSDQQILRVRANVELARIGDAWYLHGFTPLQLSRDRE